MSNQLPATVLTEEEEIQKDAIRRYMSGTDALDIVAKELEAEGIYLPTDEVWKYATRKQVEAASHAAFSMLGGVPGLVAWARKNPTAYYTQYLKLAPAETTITGGTGQIIINTGMEASALDAVEIDENGKVLNSVNALQLKAK